MALFSRLRGYKRLEHFGMRFPIRPILRNARPLGPQALLVDIGVLDDEGTHPLRVRQNDPETDRTTVVMEVEGTVVNLELLEESVGRLRQVIECIGIRRRRWSITLTEARKVRSNQVIACGEQRNESVELPRRGGEAVQ